MTQDKISALLGRPLSTAEQQNFEIYLELAQGRVSDLLCVDICQKVATRKFSARNGYRTLNVPIFTEIGHVKLDGNETTNYTVRQGSSLYGDWYNAIVFNTPLNCQVVEIKGDWGFSKFPIDLQMMIADLFSMATDSLDDDLITQKRVEDFSITLKNKTKTEAFNDKYAATIAKYSGCVNGNVQHGDVRHIFYV